MTSNSQAGAIPVNACDCHVHLFGPEPRYAFAAGHTYTPGDADEAELDGLHARLGIDRVVLVQPSVYGTDNRRLVDGLAKLGGRARGIAVVADDADAGSLDRLHAAGVRGVRVNGAITGREEPAAVWRTIEAQARLVAGRGWHVQALINPKTLSAIADRIAGLPCTLVIDHLGLPDIEAGPAATSFSALVSLVEAGRVHVKLSAMERLAGRGRLERLRPFIDRLLAAGADRLVWGTDWPHTGGARTPGQPVEAIEPFAVVDDADALALLRDVVRGSNALQSILVETPARLYDFGIAQ